VVRESVSGEMIKPAGSSAFIVVQKGSDRPLTWGIFLWLGDIFLIRNLDQLTTAAPYAGFGVQRQLRYVKYNVVSSLSADPSLKGSG
jgi:hypothetical protein